MDNSLLAFSQLDGVAYLQALLSVAYADGSISIEEAQFIKEQASSLGIAINPYEYDSSLDSFDPSSLSVVTKKLVIRDCITLACIDKNYDESERVKIFSLAQRYGLSKEFVCGIEAWLKEYWELIERGKALIEVDTPDSSQAGAPYRY